MTVTRSAFALAALLVAHGVVACSSDPDPSAADAGAPDGGASADAASGCFSNAPVDPNRVPYKPARVQAGSCTQGDVDAIVAYADQNPDQNVVSLKAEVKTKLAAKCHDCIFADDGATWAPFVLQDGEVSILNSSGCIEIASGKGEPCGRAHRQWDACINETCAGCTGTEEASCRKVVQVAGGACKGAADAMAVACGGTTINQYIASCTGKYGFDEWIKRQCVTGS